MTWIGKMIVQQPSGSSLTDPTGPFSMGQFTALDENIARAGVKSV